MKKSGLILSILLITFGTVFSQGDEKEMTRKERRQARKEQQKRERDIALDYYQKLMKKNNWVIEAHTVYNENQESFVMNPTTNFVAVEENKVTVQLGFNHIAGWNGIGGVTLEGVVNNYKVNVQKNAVNVRLNAMGRGLGVVDLLIMVSPNGNARATISGNWGNRITFVGEMVPRDESRVYKGTTF